MSTHHPHSKRHRSIPDRHAARPTFNAVLPFANWHQHLPVKMVKLADGGLRLMDTAIRISDLAKAPRVLWNLSKGYVAHLLHLDAGGRAVRVLAGWFKAAMETFKPVPSDTEWNALPPFASGKPAPYMALTNEGHMIIPQKRIVIIEKYIAHDPTGGRDALFKAVAAI